uniref:L-serine ammonia-lyase n=1 Tax=Rhodosorus marinus TaxID=101924 RepID=A0A7S0BTV5_9RHOD|mmetsp:Transcript_9215/g.13479  ORF Transcript_9215/g.13479 Transcript_9215/m.13479 type:complete len:369 (+) Transcript_9215:262-1368(+)
MESASRGAFVSASTCSKADRGRIKISCCKMTYKESVANGAVDGFAKPSKVERLHVRTPLVVNEKMSSVLGVEVLLKLENTQPSGSFKIRGIGYMCAKAKQGGARRFVSSSGGNAGAAVAHAGKMLGVETVVCVPSTTPVFMQKKLKSLGSHVVVEGSEWKHADELAREMSSEPSSIYVPPFDHKDIWEGGSSLVHEIYEDLGGRPPASIGLSVGGGGLLLSVCRGLEAVGWQSTSVLAAETEGADSLAATLGKGELVDLPEITSIAKSLGANRVSSAVLPQARRLSIGSVVVSDKEAVEACGKFLVNERFLVEPACGATLAIGYNKNLIPARLQGPLVLIVCGGNIVTPSLLQEWKAQTDAQWDDFST